jgi:hypothetical protein
MSKKKTKLGEGTQPPNPPSTPPGVPPASTKKKK